MLITHKNAEINHTTRADLRRDISPKVTAEVNESKIDESGVNRSSTHANVE